MYKKIHIPVLLSESLEALNIKEDGIYIDCTFGRGGHSFEIAKKLKNGRLISFDRDLESVHFFYEKNVHANCDIVHSNFSNIKIKLKEFGISKVDGILYDLGVSSPQIDNFERGFSYSKNCKLDMRMDKTQEKDANYILTNYSYGELFKMFKNYANDRNPRRICNKIIEFRESEKNIVFFSNDLVKIIRENIDRKKLYKKKFPENKYFQAIRIEVNDEINEIILSLNDSFKLLKHKGRIVTISFHSTEDKAIKNIFFNKSKKLVPKEIPLKKDVQDFKIINIKNNKSSLEETNLNSRSKSAKIRCIERC